MLVTISINASRGGDPSLELARSRGKEAIHQLVGNCGSFGDRVVAQMRDSVHEGARRDSAACWSDCITSFAARHCAVRRAPLVHVTFSSRGTATPEAVESVAILPHLNRTVLGASSVQFAIRGEGDGPDGAMVPLESFC